MFLLDTNILVYAWDSKDVRKRNIARTLVRRALPGEGIVSQHILGEFSAVLLHKLKPRPAIAGVLAALDSISAIQLAPAGSGVVRRAIEASQTYGIHFFDALVVASAERAGCSQIYSEDLKNGQLYFGVELVNPFV